MCDRVGIFAAGRLIGQGTMADLATRFGDGAGHLEVGFEPTDDAGRGRHPRPARGHRRRDRRDRWRRPRRSRGRSTVGDAARAAEVRTRIFAIVAEQALPLTSIREVVPSLEDIYRRAVARPARGREVAA